ncbi:hypothetical protein J4455_02930 [Candidatus Woesearchaeota archaeon]|nr:hypothetical protein [Candidatus Woesearchaeota archaeon]
MPQRFEFKGLVFIFLLFFLINSVYAANNNEKDLDECINGETGNLELEIKDPDNSDNFEPGDTINIEVKVRNRSDRTRDIKVEASLYNVDEDNTIEAEDSDDERLSPGDDERYEFDLTVPKKSRGLDDNDQFILFIKAFDENSESGACEEGSVDLDLELENKAVDIEKVNLLPSKVDCGTTSTLVVEVNNIGERKLKDVRVKASNNILNINKLSNEFDLDKFGEEDDNYIAKLYLDIPNNVETGNYLMDVEVIFDGERESENVGLFVECKEKVTDKVKKDKVLFVSQSNMPTKPIEDVVLENKSNFFTLILANIVLLLLLIFLIIVIIRD